MANPPRSRPANPWWQRWLRRWRSWRGAGLAKTHQVDLIEVDGRRLKRVIFDSAEPAVAVAEALRQVADTGRFPGLVFHQDREIQVEFIPGQLARPGRDEVRLAEFFSDIYRLPSSIAGLAESGLMPQLESDLAFLVDKGLIDEALSGRLLKAAAGVAPQKVRFGHDYIDPVAKNFVMVEGRAIAIDIEALLADQPLGMGLAKARLRWSGLNVAELTESGRSAGIPGLAAQYPFIELCFLAGYFHQKIVQRKPRHLKLEALQDWLLRA